MCLLGRHNGPFEYLNDTECRQRRLCTRVGCDSIEYRQLHDFEVPADGRIRYVNDSECWIQGVCRRCQRWGGNLYREMHDWAPFQRALDNDGVVVMERTCNHCGGYQQKTPVYVE